MEAPQRPKVRMADAEGGYPESLKVTRPTSPQPKQPASVVALRKKLGVVTISSSMDNLDTAGELPGQLSRNLEEEEDASASDSSSEGEASSLESEHSSEEEEEDPDVISSLDIHPLHSRQNASGVKLPICLPGCTDAAKLALTGAADSKVGIRQASLMKTRITMGTLQGSGLDFTMAVDLIHASLVVEPCIGPLAKDQVIVCIIPAKIDPGLAQEARRARRPSSSAMLRSVKDAFNASVGASVEKEAVGYLLYCPKADLPTVQAALARSGCYMTGLDKRYEVMKGEKAGSGSYGTVFAASDADGELVAVKKMRENTKKAVLEQEVEMLVRAQGHPAIVKFHGCFREEEVKPKHSLYSLVFDFYSRGDLYDRVAEGSRMQEKHAMIPFRDLLEALRHLHERQIFHRDIKPENLLVVNSSNKVVLTDFGIATLITDTEEMKKNLGTVGYASPEMLLGRATGFEGDLFGAGVVLYFILSRSTPFLAPTNELMAAKTQQCQVNLKYQCFEHMSDECRTLMLQLLAKSPEERPTVNEALKVSIVQKTYVTATEPALACMVRKPRKTREDQGSCQSGAGVVVKAAHHMVALSVGQLPALVKVRHDKKTGHT